jgi:hypothetical protein
VTSRTYAEDYAWQLEYQPTVRGIVSETFAVPGWSVEFTPPDSEDDRRRNTDFFVTVGGRRLRVSQRLRTYVVGDQFTLRYSRPTSPTEWQKMWDGYGDLLFYGKGVRGRRIENWFIGDMHVFRPWARSFLSRGADPPHVVIENKDHSSTFVAFSRSLLPAEFTLAEDEEAELRDAWWSIVRDGRGMEANGHGSAVRWARAGLELDK